MKPSLECLFLMHEIRVGASRDNTADVIPCKATAAPLLWDRECLEFSEASQLVESCIDVEFGSRLIEPIEAQTHNAVLARQQSKHVVRSDRRAVMWRKWKPMGEKQESWLALRNDAWRNEMRPHWRR